MRLCSYTVMLFFIIHFSLFIIHFSLFTFHYSLFTFRYSLFSYFCVMSQQPAYFYRAFSLNIASEIPVTGFEPIPACSPDVMIREGVVPETLTRVINKGVLYQSNDREFLLRVEHVAAYYVRNGDEIIVQRSGQASGGEVSAFLIGTSFGALLHQRRLLPLHACTVLFREHCLVFAGISGAGKSTLAAALIGNGGSLVADDISVIDFSGERPAVCPAFPYLKIWEDSLVHLGLSAEGLEPVRGELKKYYLPVPQFSRAFTAIDHIFMLSAHNRPDLEIKVLQGVDKFRALKKHTYLFRGIPKTGLEQNHFLLANQLAGKVPMSLITRPNGVLNTDMLLTYLTGFLTQKQHG